ncbi:MAG: hypothetical protein AAF420_07640 [Pseudomonadota bacterium]
MREAVKLVLQHPGVVDADDIDLYDFDESQPGGLILQKLIAIVLGQSDIVTAALLEHFRDDDAWNYLSQLAVADIPGIEDADAERTARMFRECISQLTRANQRRSAKELRQRAASQTSDDELKAHLRASIPYSD